MLSVMPEVRIAERLHEFGLLPEENRKKFVETVSAYAAEGPDTDALDDPSIRSLFTEDEYKTLVQRVRRLPDPLRPVATVIARFQKTTKNCAR